MPAETYSRLSLPSARSCIELLMGFTNSRKYNIQYTKFSLIHQIGCLTMTLERSKARHLMQIWRLTS